MAVFHADGAGVVFFAKELGDGEVVEFASAGFFASGDIAVLDVRDLVPAGFGVGDKLVAVADLAFVVEVGEEFTGGTGDLGAEQVAIGEGAQERLAALDAMREGFLSEDDAVAFYKVATAADEIDRGLDLLFAGDGFVAGAWDHGHVGLAGDFGDFDAAFEVFFDGFFLFVGGCIEFGARAAADNADAELHFFIGDKGGDLFDQLIALAC